MSEREVVPIKEKLSFSDIFADGKVKQIKWGDDFNAWPMDKQLDYAKALASAMNEAADKMQEDRDRVLNLLKLAQTKQSEAEQSAMISNTTMAQAIARNNETVQDLQNQIKQLQAELAEARRV